MQFSLIGLGKHRKKASVGNGKKVKLVDQQKASKPSKTCAAYKNPKWDWKGIPEQFPSFISRTPRISARDKPDKVTMTASRETGSPYP
jgi:hypothetical protein